MPPPRQEIHRRWLRNHAPTGGRQMAMPQRHLTALAPRSWVAGRSRKTGARTQNCRPWVPPREETRTRVLHKNPGTNRKQPDSDLHAGRSGRRFGTLVLPNQFGISSKIIQHIWRPGLFGIAPEMNFLDGKIRSTIFFLRSARAVHKEGIAKRRRCGPLAFHSHHGGDRTDCNHPRTN